MKLALLLAGFVFCLIVVLSSISPSIEKAQQCAAKGGIYLRSLTTPSGYTSLCFDRKALINVD